MLFRSLAFRESIVKTIRDFYKKDFDPADIRSSIIAAISIKVEEPIFESQTKTKLGSKDMGPEGPSVRYLLMNLSGNSSTITFTRTPKQLQSF